MAQCGYGQMQQDQRKTLPPTAQRPIPAPAYFWGAAPSPSTTAEAPAGSDQDGASHMQALHPREEVFLESVHGYR